MKKGAVKLSPNDQHIAFCDCFEIISSRAFSCMILNRCTAFFECVRHLQTVMRAVYELQHQC